MFFTHFKTILHQLPFLKNLSKNKFTKHKPNYPKNSLDLKQGRQVKKKSSGLLCQNTQNDVFKFNHCQICAFERILLRTQYFTLKLKRFLQKHMKTPFEFGHQISNSGYQETNVGLIPNFYGNFQEILSFLFDKIKQNQFLIANLKHKIDSCLQKIELTEQNYRFEDQSGSPICHVVKIENFHQQLSKFSNLSHNETLNKSCSAESNIGTESCWTIVSLPRCSRREISSSKQKSWMTKYPLQTTVNACLNPDNSLRVCLEVCDNDGNWVGQSQEGQDFIKEIVRLKYIMGLASSPKFLPGISVEATEINN